VRNNSDKFNCKKCSYNHHCDETGDISGSNGPAGYDIISVPGVIESRVCLLPMITPQSHSMLVMFKDRQNQLLPVHGGTLDQPNRYLQAMELLS